MSSPSQNLPSELPPSEPAAPSGAEAPLEMTDWKHEVNERLAAHRTRRAKVCASQATLPLDVDEQPLRSRARVAARVAERYAKVPTYSEMLGRQQTKLTVPAQVETPGHGEKKSQGAGAGLFPEFESADLLPSPLIDPLSGPKAVKGYIDAIDALPPATVAVHGMAAGSRVADGAGSPDTNPASPAPEFLNAGVLDHELLNASTPNVGEWIPGNVIEFPRVLVAARKARARLAEGPLREDATVDSDPGRSQLRIFEVEQQAISTVAEVESVATEWSSIRLDARPRDGRTQDAQLQDAQWRESTGPDVGAALLDSPLQTASLSDRLMAGLVDGALVALAFLAFVAVFVACTTHPPSGKPALIASACTLLSFFLLYQYLFFSYSEGTPGMRYAHIALCTFEDENPTRSQMRGRIGALLLSACPLGLGFAWAWFDDERLGWHDRMSKTYQRSYR